MRTMQIIQRIIVLVSVILLQACGGGLPGDVENTHPTQQAPKNAPKITLDKDEKNQLIINWEEQLDAQNYTLYVTRLNTSGPNETEKIILDKPPYVIAAENHSQQYVVKLTSNWLGNESIDSNQLTFATQPTDVTELLDTDNDGIDNTTDPDDDNDTIADVNDAFPLDATETLDTDKDGIGNNADLDDDNDTIDDIRDAFPLDATETLDTDKDGIGNNADLDDDNDAVDDNNDAFPLDVTEWLDSDNDGIGNNIELDDDNDTVVDVNDAFPMDVTEWSDSDNDGIGDNADDDSGLSTLSNRYYIVNPKLVNNPLNVVSLVDNNTITVGATSLLLNNGELGIIPAPDLVQGAEISGTGPFSIGGEKNATDMPVPASFSGTEFVIPHYRNNQTYFVLSPYGDANILINYGTGVYNDTAYQGQVLEITAGSDVTVSGTITSLEFPIIVSHTASNQNGSVYPVPPATTDLWGVKSSAVIVGALLDATTINIYASNGDFLENIILNKGHRYAVNIGGGADQGLGDSIHIAADKPIAAIQIADDDDGESTAFLSQKYFATDFGIPVDTQYITVVCVKGDTEVTLGNTSQTCTGNENHPGKVYFGNPTNGMNTTAGTLLQSTKPIYVIYEPSASNDEHNLLGYVDPKKILDTDSDGTPNIIDSDDDNDEIPDEVEITNNLDPLNYLDGTLDADNDGINNTTEHQLGTNINEDDTDKDGMLDGDEVDIGRNPLLNEDAIAAHINNLIMSSIDFDYDGVIDSKDSDDDNDDMPDEWELEYGLNPKDASDADGDLDGDRVINLDEYLANTNPSLPSTDGDSLSDYDEVYVYHTDPLKDDTDEDNVADDVEINAGRNPLVKESLVIDLMRDFLN